MFRLLTLSLLTVTPLTVVAAELPTTKPAEVGFDPAQLAKVDTAVESLIEQHRVVGASVLVARHGKIAHFQAYGLRDIANNLPMETDTVVRIYSMTKPITTVAAMQLFEQGKFKLDDPVAKFLPEFKDVQVYVSGDGDNIITEKPKRPPIMADLMRHTSGLTYGNGNAPVDKLYRKNSIPFSQRTLEDEVKAIAAMPLMFQPGTRYHYSLSVDVLGRVVEVLSGLPLDVYFQKNIFEPLKMTETSFFVNEALNKRFAAVHGKGEDGKLTIKEAVEGSKYLKKPIFFSGGGGLTSTMHDYARFCQMLLNKGELDGKRLLKASTIELMTKDHLPKGVEMGRPQTGFGFGFSVRTGEHAGEFGWGGAASTHFWVSPKDDFFVIVLQQWMPYQSLLEDTLKPIIYDAIE